MFFSREVGRTSYSSVGETVRILGEPPKTSVWLLSIPVSSEVAPIKLSPAVLRGGAARKDRSCAFLLLKGSVHWDSTGNQKNRYLELEKVGWEDD